MYMAGGVGSKERDKKEIGKYINKIASDQLNSMKGDFRLLKLFSTLEELNPE